MEEVNGYKLQPEIYWYGTRMVKIYSPIMVLDNEQYFWVYFLDDKDVTIVSANKLKLANDKIQILYGGPRK